MLWLRLLPLLAGLLLSPLGLAEPAVALYYGNGHPIDQFRAFDIVVVDPDHGQDPNQYRRPTSQLYAYVAVAEAHPGRNYFRQIPEDWKIARNTDWGSVVIDQTPAEWPAFLADKIVAPLWAKGYRGFFLDTLDSYRLAGKFDEKAQQQGLIRVVETLAQRFPGIQLILNRGFEIVPHVRDKIQMVAAESLFRGWNARTGRYEEVTAKDRDWLIGQLNTIRQRDRLPILAIDYLPPHDRDGSRATAEQIRQLGFIPWVADRALETIGVGAVEAVPRRILVIHNEEEAPSIRFGNAHRYLEMPLNHMGYLVDYASTGQALPENAYRDRYAGVVTWFSGALKEKPGKALMRWLEKKREEGMPLAIIGDFGFPPDSDTARRLGLTLQENPSGTIRIDQADAMLGFEAPPRPSRSGLTGIRANGPGVRPLLDLRDGKNAIYSGAAITDWGGFVLDPFVITPIPESEHYRWTIDPFAFLKTALRLPDIPAPDVTTENGRRLFFSHIDGDGFPSFAQFPRRELAAEVLYREVLQKYRVPTTVSVIESELAPDGLYPALSARMEAVARQIFALPHVEIASHSYSHPFKWDSIKHGVFANNEDAHYHLPIPGYSLDLKREIVGSIDYIRRSLAAPGKPVHIMLWSGDTSPGEEALAIAEQAGLLNMNGGDTYISRRNPSLSAVGPLGWRAGGLLQVYAPITNENIYTNLWRGPFYGYQEVIETFEMTDKPRRLKPVGIYYHTYSASKPESLKALHKAFAWAAGQELHPVFASAYIHKARDFHTMAIAREGDGWRIRGDGYLRTLRLPASLTPDLASAQGVAGLRPGKEGSYLHLADGKAWFATGRHRPRPVPYLFDGNGRLDDWQRTETGNIFGAKFRLTAHQPLDFRLADTERCRVLINGKVVPGERRQVMDQKNVLRFRLTEATANVEIACAAP